MPDAPTTGPLPLPLSAFRSFGDRLRYTFDDPDLLVRALTHRSWCAEHAGFESNERLEFLGDAVLGLVVTDDIYSRLPDAGEGQLSRIRAEVVCAPSLAEMAAEIRVGEVLLLGKGEDASGGRGRPSILADAMEAVLGAVYLDGGLAEVADVIAPLVAPRLRTAGLPDHKSRLHELVASEPDREVAFEITEEGPEHDKTFRARVILDGRPWGTGSARSKKQAEQAAAAATWRMLDADHGEPSTEALPPREEARHG